MDKIPCTGNDATGNRYRVTGGIRLRKNAQYSGTRGNIQKRSKFQNFQKLQKIN